MTTGRINQVASICDADAAAHPSGRRATAGRPSIVFEQRWCEDENDSTPPTSTASRKHALSCHRPFDARALVFRSRRPYRRQRREPAAAAASCSATEGTTVILKGRLPRNRYEYRHSKRGAARATGPRGEGRGAMQGGRTAQEGAPIRNPAENNTRAGTARSHAAPDARLRSPTPQGLAEERRGIKRRRARPAAAHGQRLQTGRSTGFQKQQRDPSTD